MHLSLAKDIWESQIAAGIASITDDELLRAAKILCASDFVITAGNGGSAALAAHAAQAIAKPCYGPGGGRAAVCLTDNISTFTAHANDGGFDRAMLECAEPYFRAFASGSSLALLAISSSGRSRNVCALASMARAKDVPVIALTGFEGEPLRQLATVPLHVPSTDYEVVEPVHDALIHRIQYHIRAIGGR